MEMHDHSKLSEIFEKLNIISESNKFINTVFWLVLFHQSIYGIKWYRPMAALTDAEAVKYI